MVGRRENRASAIKKTAPKGGFGADDEIRTRDPHLGNFDNPVHGGRGVRAVLPCQGLGFLWCRPVRPIRPVSPSRDDI